MSIKFSVNVSECKYCLYDSKTTERDWNNIHQIFMTGFIQCGEWL